MEPSTLCPSCRFVMRGADLKRRCRRNGLQATAANSEDCLRLNLYEREPGSDAEEIEVTLCSGCAGRLWVAGIKRAP